MSYPKCPRCGSTNIEFDSDYEWCYIYCEDCKEKYDSDKCPECGSTNIKYVYIEEGTPGYETDFPFDIYSKHDGYECEECGNRWLYTYGEGVNPWDYVEVFFPQWYN